MRSFDPTSERIARAAAQAHPRHVVAFSGGTDSTVLLDFVVRHCGLRPAILWVDAGFELPETRDFIDETAELYSLPLHVVRTEADPLPFWEKRGFPMLGKEAAVKWNRTHQGFRFKADCSSCCRARKIQPARRFMREHGFTLQFVGTRGSADSNTRGLRARKDGHTHDVDGITVCKPLEGWTDLRVRTYVRRHALRLHPLKTAGRISNVGCNTMCGGGSQFETSNFRQLRHVRPDLWRDTVRTLGPLILAVKHNAPLPRIHEALARLGGLEAMMAAKPWIFDFSRVTPLESYRR